MNKKIILISLIVIVCTISISGCINPIDEVHKMITHDGNDDVGDTQNDSRSSDSQSETTVLVDGIKFNMPEGYSVSQNTDGNTGTESVSSDKEVDVTYSLAILNNDDSGSELCIFVKSFDDSADLNKCYNYDESYCKSKTINGVKGLYFNVTTDGETSNHFMYIQDEKLVEFMTNDTVDVIEETIIG